MTSLGQGQEGDESTKLKNYNWEFLINKTQTFKTIQRLLNEMCRL